MIKVNMETKDGVILNTNGKYCEDYVQVTPTNTDAISAQNIKEGVTILGVEGTLESSNIGPFISKGMTTLNIPNNVIKIRNYAFYYCTELTSIIIPNSVTSIENFAFSNCSNLSDVTIPNSITNIRYYAFNGCTSLTDVTIENGFNANGLNLSFSTKYTHNTIISWLNALYDRSNLSTYTLTIGTDNLNKLTDEEKATATNKNWTLA